jgi:hypothetical protein
VKLAKLTSNGLRVATEGDPVDVSASIWLGGVEYLTVVASSELLGGDVELVVTAVVTLSPLELPVVAHKSSGAIARVCDAATCTVTARGDGSAGELDTNGTNAGGLIVGSLVEPHEVRNPVGVGVASKKRGVVDLVGVEVVEGAVAVRGVALDKVNQHSLARQIHCTYIPLIGVERVAVDSTVVHAAEDNLVANDSPCSAAFLGLGEGAVEPVLLRATHERAASVIFEILDVIIVPVKCRDAAIIIASIKHN